MIFAADEAGPRFDESLAAAARALHLGDLAIVAVAAAVVLFAWLERRSRGHWAKVPVSAGVVHGGPYRGGSIVSAHMSRAPVLVRAASFVSFAFAHLFAPLIVLSLAKYPFDGIAIPLLPGIALVVSTWVCGWQLLARTPGAPSAVRSGATASILANGGLLVLAGAHFAAVESQRRGGIPHACSASVTFVVIVFAIASLAQALLTLAALRAHGPELGWRSEGRSSAGGSRSAYKPANRQSRRSGDR